MSIYALRLEEAVNLAKLSQRHAEDLGRNFLRDWVREGVQEIKASEAVLNLAVACVSLSYDKVELLRKALGKDAAGVVAAANNDLRSMSDSRALEIVIDESFRHPIIRFAVRTGITTRS